MKKFLAIKSSISIGELDKERRTTMENLENKVYELLVQYGVEDVFKALGNMVVLFARSKEEDIRNKIQHAGPTKEGDND